MLTALELTSWGPPPSGDAPSWDPDLEPVKWPEAPAGAGGSGAGRDCLAQDCLAHDLLGPSFQGNATHGGATATARRIRKLDN